MKNLRNLPRPIIIKIAKSNAVLFAKQTGDIDVISYVNGEEIQINIKNVLMVPGLAHNLMSVRKLDENGFRVAFENRKGIIHHNNKLLAIAKMNGGNLYI